MGELGAEVTGREGSGSLGCVMMMELREWIGFYKQFCVMQLGRRPRVERGRAVSWGTKSS